MEFRPLKELSNGNTFGMEVSGIDLSKPIDDETFATLKKAWFDNSVLVFRGQTLDDEQHIALSRRFGDLTLSFHPHYRHPEHPELLRVTNMKSDDGKPLGLAPGPMNDEGVWHTDQSFQAEPPLGSMLRAIKIPVDADGNSIGDTLYASMVAAYDDLPQETKTFLDGRMSTHAFTSLKADKSDPEAAKNIDSAPPVVHPVVRTHPFTGRKSLFVVNGECVDISGVPDDEAKSMLKELFELIIRPENVYAHKWAVGDLVLWDNVTAQHKATFKGSDQIRLLHRTTLKGSVPH